MKKLTQKEIITEVVYAIFDAKISLDDPLTTIKEVTSYIRKLKSSNK